MGRYSICLLTLLCANFACWCEGQQEDDPNEMKYDQQSANLSQKIFKTYNHLIRPCGPNSDDNNCTPVQVTANMKILSIASIDDEKMHFNMQFLLRQTWNDQRLRHEGKTDLILDTGEKDTRVWTPDTFFLQEKDAYKPLAEQANNQYQISPNGDVYYSTRVATTLSCPMDLRRYPFDHQFCNIQFGSYAQTKDHVHYKWDEDRAVELAADLRHTTPMYTLGDVIKRECKHHWVTGAYSCLKAEMQFKRQFGFGSLMKNFIPSFVLVVLSWLAFYLGPESVGIRALLGAGCLQFLLIHWSILSLNLPPVAGYRTIDIWFIACIIFVFFSLLQLVLVILCPAQKRRVRDVEMVVMEKYADDRFVQPKQSKAMGRGLGEPEPPRRSDTGRRSSVINVQRKYTRLGSGAPSSVPIQEAVVSPMIPTSQYYEEPTKPAKKPSMMERYRSLSGGEKADVLARILFPVVFIIFNLAFWGSY